MDDAFYQFHDFETAAHEAFDCLCTSYGFQCVESRPDRVRYESPFVWFEIGYSVRHIGEMYALIGRTGLQGVTPGRTAEMLDLGLLLGVADPAGCAEFRRAVPGGLATSGEQVVNVLRYYAAGLRAYGDPLLTGESEAYERAGELRFWHMPGFPPDALMSPPDPAPRWWA